MSGKAKWIVILLLVVLTSSFFIGLLSEKWDLGATIGWGLLGIVISILIGLILGVSAIVHFRRTKGTKGIFIGILILLVLIPLVFAGTCALSIGGEFVRGLFFK